jgi:thiol-disulfide isomerase/thioredoxin
MKKKFAAILAVAMSLALAACGEDVEKQKDKVQKKIDEEIDKVVDDVSKYVDEETDLNELTGTTSTSSEETTTTEVSTTENDYEEISTLVDNADYTPDVCFTIFDMNDEPIYETVFREHKLTMINFWEPWCGPCVSEMPEIEKLYKNYKDKGLYVIGVFSSTEQMDDVKAVLQQAGTTYPIATYSPAFDEFQTGYVPTTIFVDQDGHVIPMSNGYSDNSIVGSNSYEQWAAIVDKYLK